MKNRLKIIQTVAEIGAESSGPSYSVPGLCRGLVANGVDVSLHVRVPLPVNQRFTFETVAHEGPNARILRRLGVVPKMEVALRRLAETADVMQINGLWMMQNVYPWRAVRWARKKFGRAPKLVVAPRGTLAAWSLKRSWLVKRIFWWLYQRAVLVNCDLFHATCEKEYEEIRAAGFKQPVAIVPIGLDLPNINPQLSTHNSQPTTLNPLHRLVFFGRIHEVKGVDRLLRAWGIVVRTCPELARTWEVVIAGPDCGGKAACERVIAEEKLPRVSFVGELHGDEKYAFLSQADLYALPSFTENFAITVAEALACETPVIASKGSPWSGVVENKCGWWVENTPEALAGAIRAALEASSRGELESMGRNGRDWIARDFAWAGIGAKMKQAYEWLLGCAERPDFVRVD